MSNNLIRFPRPTDQQYENKLIPLLVDSLTMIASNTRDGDFEEYNTVSDSLLRFATRALLFLDEYRREGVFEEGKMPSFTAFDIDNLAADCMLAFGGDEEIARSIRNRMRANGDDE